MSPGKAVCESRNGMTRYGAGSTYRPERCQVEKVPSAQQNECYNSGGGIS